MGFNDPAGQTIPTLGIALDLGHCIGLYLVPSQLRVLDDDPARTLSDVSSVSGDRTRPLHPNNSSYTTQIFFKPDYPKERRWPDCNMNPFEFEGFRPLRLLASHSGDSSHTVGIANPGRYCHNGGVAHVS